MTAEIEWSHFDDEATAQYDGAFLRVSNMGRKYKPRWWAWIDREPLLTSRGTARHFGWRAAAIAAVEAELRSRRVSG